MKYLIISILFLSTLGGCEETKIKNDTEELAMIQSEKASEFECINNQADNPPTITVAKERMAGTWQLKSIFTMIPKNEIPNIVLEVSNDLTVQLKQAGKLIHTGQLSVTEEIGKDVTVLRLKSEKQNFDNGDINYLYGYLRICENEMLIDNGMMFDAPGYYFRRK